MLNSKQEEKWSGVFGKEYTDRNTMNTEELNNLYKNNYGVSRTKMNIEFIGNMDRKIRILEVGSNTGNQLLLLQKMGFTNLYGIELQEYAVEVAKQRTKGINIIQCSAHDIPFKDMYFDLVYTSGVLIHISPDSIGTVISEIYRCSQKYIWGFEYFSETTQPVNYRGNQDLLWKADFAKLFCTTYPDLVIEKHKQYKYLSNENTDSMFLLRKQQK